MPPSFAARTRVERVTARAVVALLSPTLGWEKSEETVAGAVKLLQLPEHFTVEQALAILDVLSRVPGIVGVTARFARSRADFGQGALPTAAGDTEPRSVRAPPPPPPSSTRVSTTSARAPIPPLPPPRAPMESSSEPSSSPAPESSARDRKSGVITKMGLPLEEVAALFAHTIGLEKSRDIVRAGARRLGIMETTIDRDQASLLLDDLAKQDGLVGITARFGRARFILRFGQ